jgi:hypothetical protein
MLLPVSEIQKIIFATLLSLSVYGLVGGAIDWGSEKCPFDTKKTKYVVLIILALVSIIVLFNLFRKKATVRTAKYTVKYGPDAASKIIGT